ncbi:MAG: L,D-transpeptidase family protein [Actinomycetota bacterium]|nr:L,D-transpeptidase family protein [Actinomycetota bacterium]
MTDNKKRGSLENLPEVEGSSSHGFSQWSDNLQYGNPSADDDGKTEVLPPISRSDFAQLLRERAAGGGQHVDVYSKPDLSADETEVLSPSEIVARIRATEAKRAGKVVGEGADIDAKASTDVEVPVDTVRPFGAAWSDRVPEVVAPVETPEVPETPQVDVDDANISSRHLDAFFPETDADAADDAAAGSDGVSVVPLPKVEPVSGKKRAIVAAAVVAVCAAVYFGLAAFFHTHFLPNTFIDGINCSMRSQEDATRLVQGYIDGYELTITEREGGEETISGDAISMTYADDGRIADLLAEQNPYSWVARLYTSPHREVCSLSYDSEALGSAITQLTAMDPYKMREPSDIHPAYNGEEYALKAADYGTTLDTAKATETIVATVDGAQDAVDLDAAGCYIDPLVTEASDELNAKVDYYNKYLRFAINYTFDEKVDTLDANVAEDWLIVNDDGTSELDQDKLEQWVSDFAERHDTVGNTRTFIAADGEEHTVEGGTYGWKIDQKEEIDAINEAYEGHLLETRDPIYAQTADRWGVRDWGDTYIEVSLTDQHTWAVQDGEVVFESDVVTGLPTPKRETPEGVFYISQKSSPYVMHGEPNASGNPSYVTPCSYWMRVTNTGVGFHDATWQPYFGGSRYLSGGSHGCINMPYSGAQELYSIIEVGWPVIIYW